MITTNILIKKDNRFVINNKDFSVENIEFKTLSEKIADSIEELIKTNIKEGQKIPPSKELAQKFNVSIKTINDSVKILVHKGILQTRRGSYGTYVTEKDRNSRLYRYETAEIKIRHYISENCKPGDKLPPIREMAKMLDVSTKTIKTALYNLTEEGFVATERGRMGGIFVIDIPQKPGEAYTWLALNPNYISAIEN